MSDASWTVVRVDEIRDYSRINVEVSRLFESGASRIRLARCGGQRLLLFGLRGRGDCLIEVEGDVGPEFAAELDAADVRVYVRGSVADGVARGMRSGAVLVAGNAGDVAGYAMAGGTLAIAGWAGRRVGLDMTGGLIAICGGTGGLVGERRRGGTIEVAGAIDSAAIGGRFPVAWIRETPWGEANAAGARGRSN